MMKLYTLQWDSDFFRLRIGRADIQTTDDVIYLLSQHNQLKQQYDLIYVFDINAVGFRTNGARLLDEKILYSKHCEPHKQYKEVTFFHDTQPSKDLYRLALISGGFSRFKTDTLLPKGSYGRLYYRWIENACTKNEDQKHIFIFKDINNEVRGMITIDYKDLLGHIGLVAVDTNAQHRGIGEKLISSLEGYSFEQGIKTLEVPTQKANTVACHWYEKNGFTQISSIPIYHWWLK